MNPVVEDAQFALEATDLVRLDLDRISALASIIDARMRTVAYTPRAWRDQPLHYVPPEPYQEGHPDTKKALDWIFLVNTLNFSFWSELERGQGAYAVEWRETWDAPVRRLWHGYHALVAAIDRSVEAEDDILEPAFYYPPWRCSDPILRIIFRPADGCREGLPMFDCRRDLMRINGEILFRNFRNSFAGFLSVFKERYNGQGTALQLVQMVVDTFETFRDEVVYEGRKLRFWKRAQLLVAEIWAAFYPADAATPHPFLPHGVGDLTMFADYRVPQILHQLGALVYPPKLVALLRAHTPLEYGAREEVSIRAGSILAVEALRDAILAKRAADGADGPPVNSVLLDFYLWDLAKALDGGDAPPPEMELADPLPVHRTRSQWY